MEADRDKLKQVLLNLFYNAVKHTNPEQGVIEMQLQTNHAGAEIRVRDNGSGIPAAHVVHIFNRFYRSDSSRTRQQGGAGLGLSISHSIIKAHQGTIEVASEEGKGTIFTVLLPKKSRNL